MAKFNEGTKVINVKTKDKGVVIEVYEPYKGKQYYKVFINGEEIDLSENDLMENLNLSDPFEKLSRGIFSSFDKYLIENTIFKIENTSNNYIPTLKSSKTIFKAYQFIPLVKILNSPKHRLLVADEVGLGKTIETGHIMLELRARKELKNVLVVCPKSLQIKWQSELQNRFGLNLKIFEDIKDFIETFKTQSSTWGIINYEKLRKPKEMKNEVKIKNLKEKRRNNPYYIELFQKNGKNIDLLVCDEAHRLRNSNTLLYQGFEDFMEFIKAALFLTATPIMINQENLYNLLHLLNDVEFNELSIFNNVLSINKPFIRALNLLNQEKESLKGIAKELQECEVWIYNSINNQESILKELNGYPGKDSPIYENCSDFRWKKKLSELYKDIPLYSKIINDLLYKEDSPQTRAQLQFDISSLNKMNTIFSRTRKKDITTDWTQAVRNTIPIYIRLNKKERQYFDKITEEYYKDDTYTNETDVRIEQGGLGIIQKKRQIASSVYAYLNTMDNLEKGIDEYANFSDSKVEKLKEIIHEVVEQHRKKLIIFALFRKTLYYLQIRLKKAGYDCIIIHGGIKNRVEYLAEFRNSNKKNILLSSEVGSEGLDMQFCDAMVNFDLPWNPMVVEQRIGRIDRFGQKSKKVTVYTFIVAGSIQEIIFKKLLDRIGIFKSSIGDLEAILDRDLENSSEIGYENLWAYLSTLEKELYTTQLSDTERKEKIEDLERAICREKMIAEQVEKDSNNLLINDVYFRNEINRILNRKQYITEYELKNIINQLIEKKLSTCSLIVKNAEIGIYALCTPKADTKVLFDFISQYESDVPEMEEDFKSFKNSIRGENEILLTFRQETAYEQRELHFVNNYHPLIYAALSFLKRKSKDETRDDTFKYQLATTSIHAGNYLLALYEVKYNKCINLNLIHETKNIFPILFDLDNNIIVENLDLIKQIMGEIQDKAQRSDAKIQLNSEELKYIRCELTDYINRLYDNYYEDEKRRVESRKLLDIQQSDIFYNSKIEKLEQRIRNTEWSAHFAYDKAEKVKIRRILPALNGQLTKLKEDKEIAIRKIKNIELLPASPMLISISYVTVI